MTLASLSHILSALAMTGFLAMLLWMLTHPAMRRAARGAAPVPLTAVVAGVALWCAALYGFGPGSVEALAVQPIRDLTMLYWCSGTFWSKRAPMPAPLRLIQKMLATICIVMLLLAIMPLLGVRIGDDTWLYFALTITAMIVAAGGLLIVDSAVRRANSGATARLAVVAGGLAMLWGYELNAQLIGALTGQAASTLIALLPGVALLVLPTFIVATLNVGRDRMRLSRPAAMRTIVLIGGAAYLILIGLAGAVARFVGGDYAYLAQATFLILALGTGGLFLLSARARAWSSVMITKHFFEHRYDYRAEWMRFTATLGTGDSGEEGDASLHRRVAKALAELTGSPGALLMLPDTLGGFAIADHWRWPVKPVEEAALSLRSAFMLQETRHIVDLDAERRAPSTDASSLSIPEWLLSDPRAWVVVPVLHFNRMIAIVVLHRPAVSRSLDWEDLDVLRIAGQQAASYLAEAQSQRALSEARRFDEFNRRFAFIMHDIKNLASQLSLLARNAERHADNPAFRADMVGTLKLSAGRLSDLLVRLSPRQRGPSAQAGRVAVEPLLHELADEIRPRRTLFVSCQTGVAAWADGASVRQIVHHLVSNAIDASDADTPVQAIAAVDQGRVRIDIIDQGCGMSRAFIRDELFKPFVSTKEAGFGLGAFEALQLAQAMGGTIEVASEPGRGSCFTLWLPQPDARGGTDTDLLDERMASR
ncbi:MAG: XrtA/PEP-CTERM system histidine kinase PrsK [Sphingopyxis sp.]|uniref:XrtA/PEP-CTERM system histidine kinase PrsK n=1 Tax=Sphingopyxis sp. TaxID=1908224 RepID=UPI002ABCA4F7|nr:XrtA/PEP-CTERM system histidine kinase PrsK [Sphingopyxis sp.]MDZ3831027.1 XrtA/PEP-CTERM system histidine kinase PrsK [Sphingopyxis sp.]